MGATISNHVEERFFSHLILREASLEFEQLTSGIALMVSVLYLH